MHWETGDQFILQVYRILKLRLSVWLGIPPSSLLNWQIVFATDQDTLLNILIAKHGLYICNNSLQFLNEKLRERGGESSPPPLQIRAKTINHCILWLSGVNQSNINVLNAAGAMMEKLQASPKEAWWHNRLPWAKLSRWYKAGLEIQLEGSTYICPALSFCQLLQPLLLICCNGSAAAASANGDDTLPWPVHV